MKNGKMTLALASCLLGVGCGPSKVDQCNAFVDEGNKSQSGFVALEAALLNPESLQQRIDKIGGSAKSVKDVKLADTKLIEFRDRYAKGLEDYSKTLTEMKPILKAEGKEDEFNKHVDKLNGIADASSKLIDEINTYCTGSK